MPIPPMRIQAPLTFSPCFYSSTSVSVCQDPTVAGGGDICTASDDLFFDVLNMEKETDYLDDLFFFDAKDWDCNSCHANSSSDPDYPCPTTLNVSSYALKPYAYSQTTLALSHLWHCHQLCWQPTSPTSECAKTCSALWKIWNPFLSIFLNST